MCDNIPSSTILELSTFEALNEGKKMCWLLFWNEEHNGKHSKCIECQKIITPRDIKLMIYPLS